MKFRLLNLLGLTLLSCSALLTAPIFAAEEINIHYEYGANHGVDLSKMSGPFKISAFTDDRGQENAQLITDKDLGSGNGGYQADQAFTALIQDAFKQGFANGGAEIVESGEAMSLSGKLLSSEAQIIEREGVEMIQLTLRVSVQLQKGGRNAWQTTLFGRGRTPSSEGMVAAVKAAFDRMISELVRDDYFLQEVY